MSDIDAKLEANGLPKAFESSSNQPEVVNAATNDVAALSNSEISNIKQNAPDLSAETISKLVLPPEPTLEAAAQSSENKTEAMTETINNEVKTHEPPAPVAASEHVNGDGSSRPDALGSTPGLEPTEPIASISSQDPVAPPSVTTIEQDAISTEPVTIPHQAPVSDLRSEPHADALPPAAVAEIREEKHEQDNVADIAPQTTEGPPSPTPAVEPTVPKSNGLPSPPAQQSPPPAPVPEPASLSTEIQPVSATVSIERPIPDEKPTAPAPTPVVAEQVDQEMIDAPPQTVKTAREREEDTAMDMDEPATKRMKTDEDHPMSDAADFKVPDPPTTTASSGEQPPPQAPADDMITLPRLQHMKKVISNLKKSNASASFRTPVDPVALNIPTYLDIVKNPMDLSKIDNKLKKNEYSSVSAFKEDFDQILKNCVLFNGPEHAITVQGRKMEQSFTNQMQHLPSAQIVEPSKADKKAAKPKIEPMRQPPRRSSVTAKASSPNAVTSPVTFAVDPNGMPLLRRDSSAVGDRPKRAIVPTKRNSDFSGARPKKKKYELELRFCEEVLKTISSAKHWQMNQYFTHPVDPVALNIPTYYQIIKKPMDLGTVKQNLEGGMYERAKDFEEDVRLIFKNCYKFNVEGDLVYKAGQELERLFNQEWAKKADWIHAREPDSPPASVGDDDDNEDDSSEEEAEESDDNNDDKIKALKAQIAAMAEQVGELSKKKKKKTPPTGSKKSKSKSDKKSKSSQFPNLGKNKDKKSTKSGSKSSKPEKDRYVTFAEKQYISNGIALLPERQMQEALRIIQSSVPSLASSDQNEIELDIEEVPNHALLKLLTFVQKYAGPPPEETKAEAAADNYGSKSSKKNRGGDSLTRREQEAQLAELRGQLQSFNGSGSTPEGAMRSIEQDSSEDDDSDQESEEE